MVVVADTSPLNYLVQIDEADLLQKLYGTVVIPGEVFEELNHPGAPTLVGKWIRQHPPWLEIRSVTSNLAVPSLLDLDARERAAIQLALAESKALLLIDDGAGRREAERLGLSHVGTLGVLRLASAEGLIKVRVVLEKLAHTNFRVARSLVLQLIAEDEEQRQKFSG